VAKISPDPDFSDRLGGWKARWGIGRMNYVVPPGLYAIGTPAAGDPVLVTANYKMSYDVVRRSLTGRSVWLLVLETYGINVWCAAGKGTFGTGELVRRIASSGLGQVVSHRRVILPILGAPGVSAHEVARRSGFSVSYATIRANDLPHYLDSGMSATPAMRELTFSLYERLVLIPVELVLALKYIAIIGVGVLLLVALMVNPAAGLSALCAWVGAAVAGIVVGPLLLPWLPGRSFALKGAEAGLSWCCLLYLLAGRGVWNGWVTTAAFLALPAISAFYTLNFTGCTPFTSRSGVKKEMRIALPAIGLTLLTGMLLLLTGRFIAR
jgi:CO dehydrogenase/acetyl-CoA synthase delta subunit